VSADIERETEISISMYGCEGVVGVAYRGERIQESRVLTTVLGVTFAGGLSQAVARTDTCGFTTLILNTSPSSDSCGEGPGACSRAQGVYVYVVSGLRRLRAKQVQGRTRGRRHALGYDAPGAGMFGGRCRSLRWILGVGQELICRRDRERVGTCRWG